MWNVGRMRKSSANRTKGAMHQDVWPARDRASR